MTLFTKSFSFQQMKAKKMNSRPVLMTKVQTVLSIFMYLWAKNNAMAMAKYKNADFKSYGIGAFFCPTK